MSPVRSEADEHELIMRAIEGDDDAWQQIYKLIRPSIVTAIGTICSEDDREDYVQVSLLHVFRKLNTFSGESTLKTWVFRVSRNVALMLKRARRGRQDQEAFSIDEPLEGDDGDTNAKWEPSYTPKEYEFAGDMDKVRRLMSELAPGYQKVMRLRLEGWEFGEIAQQLGISEGCAKSQCAKARGVLTKRLIQGVDMSECVPCRTEGNGGVVANWEANPSTGRVAMCHDHYQRATAQPTTADANPAVIRSATPKPARMCRCGCGTPLTSVRGMPYAKGHRPKSSLPKALAISPRKPWSAPPQFVGTVDPAGKTKYDAVLADLVRERNRIDGAIELLRTMAAHQGGN